MEQKKESTKATSGGSHSQVSTPDAEKCQYRALTGVQFSCRITQNFSNSAAAKAQPAEKAKAASTATLCHSQPNISEAGNSITPAVRLNQP